MPELHERDRARRELRVELGETERSQQALDAIQKCLLRGRSWLARALPDARRSSRGTSSEPHDEQYGSERAIHRALPLLLVTSARSARTALSALKSPGGSKGNSALYCEAGGTPSAATLADGPSEPRASARPLR